MSCVSANDLQLARLADAIAQRVGQQRFHVWFNNSTRLDLRQDGLEIAVPNDFISEWIGKNFTRPIQEAAHEVLGCPLVVRFSVVPELFEVESATRAQARNGAPAPGPGKPAMGKPHRHVAAAAAPESRSVAIVPAAQFVHGHARLATPVIRHSHADAPTFGAGPRLRHDLETFVVGAGNQLAYNTALYVAEFPGSQYNPLFIHGNCGLGKTHLLQGLCQQVHRAPSHQALDVSDRRRVHQRIPHRLAIEQARRLPPEDARPRSAGHRRRAFPRRQESDAGRIPPHVQRHRSDGPPGGDGQRQPSQADRGVRRIAGQPLRQRHGRADRSAQLCDALPDPPRALAPDGHGAERRSDQLGRPAGDAERARAGRRDHAHRRPRATHRPRAGRRHRPGSAGRSRSPARRAGAARRTSFRPSAPTSASSTKT